MLSSSVRDGQRIAGRVAGHPPSRSMAENSLKATWMVRGFSEIVDQVSIMAPSWSWASIGGKIVAYRVQHKQVGNRIVFTTY